MHFILFVACAIAYIGVDGALAPFITPCRSADSACLLKSAQVAVPVMAAGIPALGVEPLDPMLVPRVAASQAGLDMDFKNTVVRGLRNCLILDMKRRGNKMMIEMKCSVTLVGEYKLGGKLLVLPIEGTGKYKIRIRDIVVKYQFEVSNRERDGNNYWIISNWRHTANVLTNVDFQFQNLFNGNKQLSDAIHEFANTNWKDIFHELAPPIVQAIVDTVVVQVNKMFDKVPVDQLSLD